MPRYRLFVFDADNRIQSKLMVEADNDAHALGQARRLNHPHVVEVYELDRLVARAVGAGNPAP